MLMNVVDATVDIFKVMNAKINTFTIKTKKSDFSKVSYKKGFVLKYRIPLVIILLVSNVAKFDYIEFLISLKSNSHDLQPSLHYVSVFLRSPLRQVTITNTNIKKFRKTSLCDLNHLTIHENLLCNSCENRFWSATGYRCDKVDCTANTWTEDKTKHCGHYWNKDYELCLQIDCYKDVLNTAVKCFGCRKLGNFWDGKKCETVDCTKVSSVAAAAACETRNYIGVVETFVCDNQNVYNNEKLCNSCYGVKLVSNVLKAVECLKIKATSNDYLYCKGIAYDDAGISTPILKTTLDSQAKCEGTIGKIWNSGKCLDTTQVNCVDLDLDKSNCNSCMTGKFITPVCWSLICSYSPLNTIERCYACQTNNIRHSFVTNVAQCWMCPTHCKSCNADGCIRCNNGYFFNELTWKCQICIGSFLETKILCETCPGRIWDVKCINCPLNCIRCSIKDVCDQCFPGKSWSELYKMCVDCSVLNSENCKQCSTEKKALYYYENQCFDCYDGMTLDTELKCSNCGMYVNKYLKNKFWNNISQCVDCPTRCNKCIDSNKCIKCQQAHYFNPISNECDKCPLYCTNCSNLDSCTDCGVGRYFEIVGKYCNGG
ncbi:hypothetical protein A3Q56_01152 [Intoshia linei]|uniref:Uncharacterized protein n=1 Tax=Intoshia linei TaxID=1819745 RepID=A0A177B9Y4_9BILA|nr:hypothetical protein A3Q56_01152 [Intoshia linei]